MPQKCLKPFCSRIHIESRFYKTQKTTESRFYSFIKKGGGWATRQFGTQNIESNFKYLLSVYFHKSTLKVRKYFIESNTQNTKVDSKQTTESRFHTPAKILLTLALLSPLNAAPLPFSFSKTMTDVSSEKDGLELDLNRIALNFSQNSLSNQSLYSSFSDSNLSGNSQLALQFFFTFNANYYSMRFVSFNSMIAEYGFTEIKQTDSSTIRNKSLDRLLFSTDYTQRSWDFDLGFESFEAGPFLKASYQTEFNPTPALGRRHIINYVLGAKLFDGKYIKSLYFDFFGEHDLNRTTEFNGFGAELGISLEYWLNKSVRFLYSMNFKHYIIDFRGSRILPEYQFLIETRIEANLFRTLSISPTLRYYRLKAKDIEIPASNLILGVSLNFGKVLKPAAKPLDKYQFLY
ncbi:hypothetical protein [Helicobacter saguini]|nr:hypothetical protein [Helicobacter saguini]